MKMAVKIITGLMSVLLVVGATLVNANAMSLRLLAVVEGEPITDGDVAERMRLEETLANRETELSDKRKKSALQELVDDVIKRKEAKRLSLNIPDSAVDERLKFVSQQLKMTPQELEAKLNAKDVSMKSLREQIRTSIAFRNILRRLYNVKVDVTDAEVDRRLLKFKQDPRLQPIKAYKMREITLPLGASGAQADQIAYARSIEAQGIMQKYRGCHTAKSAVKGVFDVRVSEVREAPEQALPPELVKAVRKAGTRKLIGPVRTPNSIQLFAFCGIREVAPPLPSKEAVKNIILNEKFAKSTERVMRRLRRSASIDYKVDATALGQSKLKATPVAKQQPRTLQPSQQQLQQQSATPQQGYALPRGQANIYVRPQPGQYQPQYVQPQYQQGYVQPQYAQPQYQPQYVQPQYQQPYVQQQYQQAVPVTPTPQYVPPPQYRAQ